MIFLNSVSSAAALVFYLPGVCTHTDTEGKQSQEYFKIFGKNTIFNEHPVVFFLWFFSYWLYVDVYYILSRYLSKLLIWKGKFIFVQSLMHNNWPANENYPSSTTFLPCIQQKKNNDKTVFYSKQYKIPNFLCTFIFHIIKTLNNSIKEKLFT